MFHSIIPYCGYSHNQTKSLILFEYIDDVIPLPDYKIFMNGLRKQEAYRIQSRQQRIIFIYGIACAMEFLEKNNKNVIYRLFTKNDIFLGKSFHNINLKNHHFPFIRGIESNETEELIKLNQVYLAPELRKDPNCTSSKINVYSFGILLILLYLPYLKENEIPPFYDDIKNCNGNEITKNLNDINIYKILDEKLDSGFKGLLALIDEDPDKRPSFTDICNIIEKQYNRFQYSNITNIPRETFGNYVWDMKPLRNCFT